MKKKLGPFSLLWVSFTSMIGSGWLFGSLYSAHFAGPAAILSWPIAGILLLIVALSYAEIATMFPQADILAILPLYTHGRLTSVIMSTLAWISLATIPVIETQGLIQYASNYLPHIVTHHGIHYSMTPLGYGFALILLMSFVLLNYFGIRFFAYINACFTIWKLIIPSVTVILLISVNYHGGQAMSSSSFMPYGWQGVMAAISGGGVFFSLLGFTQVVILASEIEQPEKYIPIVLVSSLLLTTLLYTALQWSFIVSMRSQDLVHGWANLSFPGDAGPFAALAVIAGLIWLCFLLYGDAFISPYSTGLAYSTTAAQMLASMSNMGNAPHFLDAKNAYQAPWISLGINFLFGAILFLLLRNWQEMAAFLVSVMMVSYAIGPICAVALRQQIPAYHRPFRLRFIRIIAFLGFYICTAGIYWAAFHSIIRLFFLTVLGLIIYIYFSLRRKNRSFDLKNSLWLFAYLLGLTIFSYFGNYGGKHYIPMYWDLFYLSLFSLVIFNVAYFSRKSNSYTQQLINLTRQR